MDQDWDLLAETQAALRDAWAEISALREAAQMALDALENHTAIKHPQQRAYRDEAIEALRAALQQPEQAPGGRHPVRTKGRVQQTSASCESVARGPEFE